MLKRRRFVIALGAGALFAPVIARGQALPQRLVGVLMSFDIATLPVFIEGLRQLGYEDGKNVKLLIRSAKSDYGLLPALARELVDAKVEVIVTINTPAARAAVEATKTVPVVASGVGDPIGSGLVSNLSRPGGNVTGLSNMVGELGPKRLALFNELVPSAKRIAVLYNPIDPVTEPQIRDIRRVAPKLGVEVRFFPVKSPKNLPESFQEILAWRAQSALWLAGQSVDYEPPTTEWAARHRLPVMASARNFVEAGGLLSYSADGAEIMARTAVYVDKILKGAKPGDLPVEQPTKFELVINRKTAKALGLKIPNSILVQATKVIE